MIYVYAFLANFVYIAFKAFQQRNVMGSHYASMVPTSMLMGMCEAYIYATVALAVNEAGLPVWLLGGSFGIGGGLGAILATIIHKRINGKRN